MSLIIPPQYGVFAGVSFFAGTIHNKLGTRLTLFLGACGYSLYIASFLCYNHTQNAGFVTAAGECKGCRILFAQLSVSQVLSLVCVQPCSGPPKVR